MRVVLLSCVLATAASGAAGTPGTPGPVSHQVYERLLGKYVGADGAVDYGRWKAQAEDVRALDGYLRQLSEAPPFLRPERFGTPQEELGYWLNLYNGLVIREILRRWPLPSVLTVGAADGGSDGKAFFRDLRFSVGGKSMSLDDLEHQVIRGAFRDARIHFALNCGARSCPVLKPEAFVGKRLVEQLESASVAFINDPANVSVRHAERTVHLSKLFEWYQDDFLAMAKARASPPDLLGLLQLYARPELAASLRRARAEAYRLVYVEYDWAVNASPERKAPVEPAASLPIGAKLPDVEWTLLSGETWRPSQARGKVILLDFWATYCKPCRVSMPALQRLEREHRAKGLVVLGVSQDPDATVIPAFLRALGITFPIAHDPDGAASGSAFGVSELPTQLLVDRAGVIRFRHVGLRQGELQQLSTELERLLQEPEPAPIGAPARTRR